MAVLSKAAQFLGFQVFQHTCYEGMHTWESDCNKAIAVAVPNAIMFCLRTYGTLYVVSNLLTAKNPKKVRWTSVLKATVQSSIFLTSNLVLYLWFLCRVRHALGFFTVPTMGLSNGLLSSFIAILLEKKSRRPALALYLTNLASETAFRQLVNHGYLKFIPNGEWIPFAIGITGFMYLKAKGRLPSALDGVLDATHKTSPQPDMLGLKTNQHLPTEFKNLISLLRSDYSRTQHCDHAHSCVSNGVEGFAKNFTMAFGVSSLLTVLRNLKGIVKSPAQLPRLLLSAGNLKIPLFFGLLPVLYHGTQCALNRTKYAGNEVAKKMVSGAVSGLAMKAFPNVSIAMYTMWKMIESIYCDLADRGLLPYVKHGDIILYTISTGYVLFCASIEPHAMRKGYWNFLSGLTGDRIKLFNRPLMDYLGVGCDSSRLTPDYVLPPLDPRLTTINPATYMTNFK